ncbi:class I SAM-dependent methyltransferase [soil metagenome]
METDKVFKGPVPQLYNRHLGPILFQPFAEAVAERLKPADHAILETAAGTGIVTRAMAAALPRSTITATDLNQAMLDVAAVETKTPAVTWKQADAQALPFDAQSFDVVVCGFGAMFFPDRPAAYRDVKRVLRLGGRLIFTVWDRIETTPLMQIAEETTAGLYPDNPPRFFSRTPCGYHDKAAIERDLRQAGFTSVTIEEVQRSSEVSSASEAAMGMCQGTPLRGELEARNPQGLAQATEAVTTALEKRFGGGAFRASLQALLVTAS